VQNYSARPRNIAIDIAKGIGIILVIIGHGSILAWIKDAIFSFHMPLFFILSGYFFHLEEKPKVRFKKDFNRLIFPYILTMSLITIYMLVCHLVIKKDGFYYINKTLLCWIFPTSTLHNLDFGTFSIPIWFLFALFWTKGVFNLIENIHSDLRYLILLALVALAFYINYLKIDLPFSISQGLICMLFYWGGYEYKRLANVINIRDRYKIFIIPFVIILWIVGIINSDLNVISLKFHNIPLSVITGFSGTLVTLFFSDIIVFGRNNVLCLIPKLLSWAGRNSMVILCAHSLFRFLPIMSPFEKYGNTVTIVIQIIFCFITVLLCNTNKWTKSLFGMK
jgi:fucose 4-O-acetylase-like acetyltransferase